MDDALKGRLTEFQNNWEAGKSSSPSDNRVPPGQYRMQLQNAEVTESMTSGKLLIIREHIIIDGEFLGRVVRDFISLETDFGPRMTAQFIQQMGMEPPERIDALPDILAAITEAAPKYLARVKHSGDFLNVSIGKLLDTGEVGTAAPPVAPKPSKAPAATQAKAPPPAAPAPANGDDRYDELVAFCQERGVPVTDGDTADVIVARLGDYDWSVCKDLTGEQMELLSAFDLLATDVGADEAVPEIAVGMDVDVTFDDGNLYPGTVTALEGTTVTVAFEDGSVQTIESEYVSVRIADAQDQAFTELIEFCNANKVTLDPTDDMQSAAVKVAEYEWDKSRLTPAELELLSNLPGVTITYTKPKPPAKPAPSKGKK
jgi:hypothetical protein